MHACRWLLTCRAKYDRSTRGGRGVEFVREFPDSLIGYYVQRVVQKNIRFGRVVKIRHEDRE